MEDKNQMCGNGEVCCCKMCKMVGEMHGKMCPGGHCRWSFMIIKVIVCLVVLGIIFAVGIKLGELKGDFSRGCGNLPGRSYMMNQY